jgi:hypothetical protein
MLLFYYFFISASEQQAQRHNMLMSRLHPALQLNSDIDVLGCIQRHLKRL